MKEPICKVLIRYFDKPAFLKWFASGIVIGIAGWVYGKSNIPVRLFKFACGFGWLPIILMIAAMIAAAILSFMAFYLRGQVGHLADGDFQNTLRVIHPKLFRATSALFGLVVIAAVCWRVTGSISAAKTSLLGILLGGTLLWCWAGLAVIDDELSKRLWQ